MLILNLVVTTVIFCSLSLIAWWYFIFFKYKRCFKDFCAIPNQLPLVGMTYTIRNTVDVYNQIELYRREPKKNVFVMLGPIPVLFTFDAKMFSIILRSRKHIDKPFLFQRCLNKIVENSLISANGNEWRHQRKILNPALDYVHVMGNINIFNAKSNDLIKQLRKEINNESTEIAHILQDWSLEQIYATMLGDTESVHIDAEIKKTIKLLMKTVIEKMISPSTYFSTTYIFTKTYWNERKALKTLNHHVHKIIERKKKEFCNGITSERKQIFIDILMNLLITNNVTEQFIAKQIILVIAAGFETSATSLANLLYNLAKFPEIQQKAFEEVYSILGEDRHQSITNQQVTKMKYLDLVIQESLRLISTIPMFLRKLEEDVDYEGNILPKGLTICMIPHLMHKDPDLYPDPENFIPERFLPENMNRNRYSYTPFNAGVRNCIGQKYAMVSLKVVLAKLLLNYEFVNVHHKLCFSIEMTLHSKTGVRVGIRKRKYLK